MALSYRCLHLLVAVGVCSHVVDREDRRQVRRYGEPDLWPEPVVVVRHHVTSLTAHASARMTLARLTASW